MIAQGYDELNRLTGRSVTLASGVEGDDTESFEYDALNRPTEAQDDDSTVQFTYNSLSQMLTEVQGANPLSTEAKTVTYTPDLDGNVTDVEYPSSFEAVRTIDDDGRVSAIEDGSSNDIVSWAFYGGGRRTKTATFGNTTTGTYSWDGFRRPTSISHKDSSPTEFAGFSHGWDKNDNPTFEKRSHDSNMGDVYTYDQANRLTQVKVDVANPVAEVITPGSQVYDHKVDWTLDDVHNFTSVATTPYGSGSSSVSYTVNAMNEYDPQRGRFLQRDPLEYVDGPNARSYGNAIPLRSVDPQGLDVIVVGGAVAAGIAEGTGAGTAAAVGGEILLGAEIGFSGAALGGGLVVAPVLAIVVTPKIVNGVYNVLEWTDTWADDCAHKFPTFALCSTLSADGYGYLASDIVQSMNAALNVVKESYPDTRLRKGEPLGHERNQAWTRIPYEYILEGVEAENG